jgi:hypothetical protein
MRNGTLLGNGLEEWTLSGLTADLKSKIGRNATNGGDDPYERLKAFLSHQRDLGHNMVFSTEHMSSYNNGNMITQPWIWIDLLEGFHVKVIIAYHHYFQWWRSNYYQAHISKPKTHLSGHHSHQT